MKKLIITAIAVVLALTATACSSFDVVQKDAVRAFGETLDALPSTGGEEGIHYLTAPDGMARFSWSQNGASISVDAAPFVAAGLDLSKLQNVNEGEIVVSKNFGASVFSSTNPSEAFRQLISNHRDILGYHAALDHYNVSLGNGNLFEWAKDLNANDKDVVFVLDPATLIAAGVDPNAIDGWAFAKVTVDIDGKPTEVDKFLKPVDIR